MAHVKEWERDMQTGGEAEVGDNETVLDGDGREMAVIVRTGVVYRLWWHEADAVGGRRRELLLGSYPSLTQARNAAARRVAR